MKFAKSQSNFSAGKVSPLFFGSIKSENLENGCSVLTNFEVQDIGGMKKRQGSNNKFYIDSSWGISDDSVLEYVDVVKKDGSRELLVLIMTLSSGDITIKINVYDSEFNILASNINDFNNGNKMRALGVSITSDELGKFTYAQKDTQLHFAVSNGLIAPFTYDIETRECKSLNPKATYFGALGLTRLFNDPYRVPMENSNTDENKTINITNTDLSVDSRKVTMTSNNFDIGTEVEEYDIVYLGTLNNYNTNEVTPISNYYYVLEIVNNTTIKAVPFYYWRGTPDYDALDTDKAGSVSNVTDFRFSAWSDTKGFPKIVSSDDGRIIYANTKEYPSTFWASSLFDGTFVNFVRFVETASDFRTGIAYEGQSIATDPYSFSLSPFEFETIKYIVPSTGLVIGTDKREYIASGVNGPITATNIQVKPHSRIGGSDIALMVERFVIFVSQGRDKIYAMTYADENGSFTSVDISAAFSDKFLGQNKLIKDLVYNQKSKKLWVIQDDGTILCINVLANSYGTFALNDFSVHARSSAINKKMFSFNSRMYIEEERTGLTWLPYFEFDLEQRYESDNGLVTDKLNLLDNADKYYREIPLDSYISFAGAYPSSVRPYDFVKQNDQVMLTGDADFQLELINQGLSIGDTYYVINVITESTRYIELSSTLGGSPINFGVSSLQGTGKLLKVFNGHYIPSRANTTVNFVAVPFSTTDEVVHGVATVDADGYVQGLPSVNDSYQDLIVGDIVRATYASVPIEAGQVYGPAQMEFKRISSIGTRFFNTYSFKIGTEASNLVEVVVANEFGDKATGNVRENVHGNTDTLDHFAFLVNDKFEPCHISSLTFKGETSNGF